MQIALEKLRTSFEKLRDPSQRWTPKKLAVVVTVGVVLCALVGIFLPFVPIILGVLLLIPVGVHTAMPSLRPEAEALLRVPVSRPRRRYTHIAIIGATGLLLITGGAVGSSLRGRFFSQHEQRSQELAANAELVDDLLGQARMSIESGDFAGAELLLWNAMEAGDVDSGRRGEVEDLIERLQACNNTKAILETMIAMSDSDFAALENATGVPRALDFGEKALTGRAVRIALDQLEEAKRRRAQP